LAHRIAEAAAIAHQAAGQGQKARRMSSHRRLLAAHFRLGTLVRSVRARQEARLPVSH
jgi:hypothetical protein